MKFRFLIVLGVLLCIDWYFYQSISTVMKNSSDNKKNIAAYIYWGFSIFSALLILAAVFFNYTSFPKFVRVYCWAIVLVILLVKIVGCLFILTDDLIRLFRWGFSYIPAADGIEKSHSISRLKFVNQIGLLVAALPFTALIYGMLKGGFDIRIKKTRLVLPNLPHAFNGLRIVQISDIHCGSFTSNAHFENAAKMIEMQKPDILFFTGDLVNDLASETDGFIETFSKMKAPMGTFSSLGNHDYADYITWDSKEAKAKNLEDLKAVHAKVGWRLLLNENVALERGGEKIVLIGIENWGAKGFTKYGNLKKAYQGVENYPVKILLSHDPSHWEAQVLKEYPEIDLTFAGHTHGMQFGVDLPHFKWSPVKYFYKQWSGLYEQAGQYLYVNTGLGFIGYPGRVGILPEITVIELYNA